ncbi:transcriptional regulator (GntR family) [[Clostridium] ultunense Esp]|nr:transcriptional regulator (GntR family) [[Clostridium] ultunense Esp]
MLNIDAKSNVPIFEQIVWQIKILCLKGVLKPDDKLPSVRQLSAMLIVNPNTVSKAYQELERQGIIETRQGKGTFISSGQNVVPDGKQKENVLRNLQKAIIDAFYVGLSKDDIHKFVDEQLGT